MKKINQKMNKKGNRICGRIYIIVKGILKSPVLIGSGEDEMSDYDVILDAQGVPFFPGSSIAGAIRSYLKKAITIRIKEELEQGKNYPLKVCDIEDLFGSMKSENQSRLYVYDGKLENATIIKRDGVRLNQYKTTENMGKFDLQAVETGALFELRFEIIQREKSLLPYLEENFSLGHKCTESEALAFAQKKDMEILKLAMCGIGNGELLLGGKSHRGFGKLEIENAKKFSFNMMNEKDGIEWLSWNWETACQDFERAENILFDDNDFESNQTEHRFIIPLEIDKTLLIRQYTDLSFGKKNNPSCKQLQISIEGKNYAVIPGSTWAGAIRSKIASFILQFSSIDDWEKAQKCLEPFFGTWSVDAKSDKKDTSLIPSKLIFEESIVQGGHPLALTRNAVDRFTGGTVDGALYTEEIWVGGTVNLVVRWSKSIDGDNTNIICGMLYLIEEELKNGFLAIGGETGVGRGIFKSRGAIQFERESLDKQNREEKNLDEMNPAFYIKQAIKWCSEQRAKE